MLPATDEIHDIMLTLNKGGMNANRAYWLFAKLYDTQSLLDVADEYEWKMLVRSAVLDAYKLPEDTLFLDPKFI